VGSVAGVASGVRVGFSLEADIKVLLYSWWVHPVDAIGCQKCCWVCGGFCDGEGVKPQGKLGVECC